MPIFLTTGDAPSVESWVTAEELDECKGEATPTQVEEAAAVASEILRLFSGQQFGIRDVTVRPARVFCSRRREYNYPAPDCGGSGYVLRLPTEVISITEVRLDGVVIPSSEYDLYNSRDLWRTRDAGPWPCCQDMTLDTTEPHTWQVSYVAGAPVPAGGKLAARLFACEILKAVNGDKSCQLPERVQTVTRQGITFTLLDNLENLDKKRTGITTVDTWLASINPEGHQARPRVWNPDDIAFNHKNT